MIYVSLYALASVAKCMLDEIEGKGYKNAR